MTSNNIQGHDSPPDSQGQFSWNVPDSALIAMLEDFVDFEPEELLQLNRGQLLEEVRKQLKDCVGA